MRTAQSRVRWRLYVYPWSPVYPDDQESSGGIIAKSAGAVAKIPKVTSLALGKAGEPQEKVDVTGNIKHIAFNRNKEFHDNSLRVVVKGPVHETFIVGNWVVLKSSINMPTPQESSEGYEDVLKKISEISSKQIPRFIGQITDISPGYEKNEETGQVSQVTHISIREWSHVFSTPIRFDEASILSGLKDDSALPLRLLKATTDMDYQQMQTLAKTVMNPFQFVYVMLMLIGAADAKGNWLPSSLGSLNLPAIALRMPILPRTLLDDLGVSGGSGLDLLGQISIKNFKPPKLDSFFKGKMKEGDEGANVFATKFQTTITGTLKGPLHNNCMWSGVFNSGEIDKMAFGELYNNTPRGRAATTGIMSIIAQGLSAWQIFQETGDLDFNEVFTDMLYELSGDNTKVIAKPVFWMRDKPFAVKSLIERYPVLKDSDWTRYDDLPRMFIPSVFVQKLNFQISSKNSFNYIKLEFLPQNTPSDLFRTLSILFGIHRDRQDDMARFGGQPKYARTNYIPQDVFRKDAGSGKSFMEEATTVFSSLGNMTIPTWFQHLKFILDVWWGEYYKAPPATLVLKDYNVPISLGFNICFRMGDIMLVGHVTGTSSNISIDESGTQRTETVVNLDRVMKTVGDPANFNDSGLFNTGLVPKGLKLPGISLSKTSKSQTDLEFINPKVLTNILNKKPPEPPEEIFAR